MSLAISPDRNTDPLIEGMTLMNQPWMKGKWNEYKGKVKERWGKLTDDDVDRVEGKRDQLVGAVQQRYGRSREEAERELDEWEKAVGLR